MGGTVHERHNDGGRGFDPDRPCLRVAARGRMVPPMGFLDKLLGRTKETAGEAADKAAPVVDKAQDAAGDARDKAGDAAGDAGDEAKDAVSDLTHRGDEAAESAEPGPGTGGSAPPAA
jgi:uncharacterized protein YjbJ (UPF0337 family)